MFFMKIYIYLEMFFHEISDFLTYCIVFGVLLFQEYLYIIQANENWDKV